MPECTGKTLEQVDYMFHEGVPLREFSTYDLTEYDSLARHQESSGIDDEKLGRRAPEEVNRIVGGQKGGSKV